MHSVVTNATWSSDRPVTSKIGETTFKHEFSCVLTRGTGVDPHECDCYVSHTRLVMTPVGDVLPTTEPDPRPDLRRAERLQRENTGLWIALGGTSSAGLICLAALIFTFQLGVL